MLADDKDDVAGLRAFNGSDKPIDIKGIDRLVVGLGGVVLESLVMEHQSKTALFKPTLLSTDSRVEAHKNQDEQNPTQQLHEIPSHYFRPFR